jgi:hypothetical protein
MARAIHYEDLSLAIEPEQSGGYRVRTLRSPYGPAAAPFGLPFQRQELEEMIRKAATGVRRCPLVADSRAARDLVRTEPIHQPSESLRDIGARLFRSLFHGPVRETYLLSRGRAESLPDRGLRIRIVLPADIPEAGLLQALPWELLYCEETGEFLARSVLTPVVRILPLPWVSAAFPESEARQIRILIVVAQPRGSETLDDADERARILEAWCRQQSAEAKLLLAATLRDLYEALRSEHYQVVHFIAHGSFDPATGVGSLLLENSEGAAHLVPSNVLAETLRASRELRLVFLNSCSSAQVGQRPGQDPLLAAAAALVRRGIPAVLAMQFPVSDLAARLFSEAVYRSLSRGSSLEAAVTDGRLALHQANADSWEWITPALFAALTESDVFLPLCPAAEDRVARGKEIVVQVSRLLRSRSYARAQQVVEAQLEQGVDVADLHYYLALALLGGRRPRSLKVSELRPIESSVRRALDLDDCATHHLCLLAFLQRDFYLENQLSPRPPLYEDLLQRAATAPRDLLRLAELVELVPWAEPVVALVGARGSATGSDPR